MIDFVLTLLTVAGVFTAVDLAFQGSLRIRDWLWPAVPGWFKPDLRDESAQGWLARLPRAPIRHWRWSRKRHVHQWGPWRIVRRETGSVWGQGCATCPVIRTLDQGEYTTSEETSEKVTRA